MKIKHIYQNFAGWFTFKEFYDKMIAELPKGAKIVEVGVYTGQSLSYLVIEGINSFREFEITGVDIFDNSSKNLETIAPLYSFILNSSIEASKQFEDHSLDLVYIDAEHTFDAVFNDIEYWMNKVKKGGYLAGHDYSLTDHPEVCRAVDALFPNRELLNDSWYIQL